MWKVKVVNLKNNKVIVESFESIEGAVRFAFMLKEFAIVPYKCFVKKEVA